MTSGGGAPATEAATPATKPDHVRALLLLRVALGLFAAGALIGGPWDMLWHLQTPFESFFSPPHLFIYGMTAAAIAMVAAIATRPALRAAFGVGRALPLLKFQVPGSLLFLGGGLLVLLLSGALDELWHGAFGTDETRFSTPHAMFGWGLFVTTLGFASARLALREQAPLGRAEAGLLSFLTLSFSLYAFLLPFLVYPTDATLRAIAGSPVIQAQPGASHTFRIYEAWGIERSNPVFALIACAWGGAVMVLSGLFDDRKGTALLATAIASALYAVLWYGFSARLGTAGDPRTWLPLPALPALAVLVAGAPLVRARGRAEWYAGAVFAGLTVLVWPAAGMASSPGVVGLLFVAGLVAFKAVLFLAGLTALAVVEPRGRRPLAVLLVLGIAVPLVLGLLDLGMRWTTH